MFDVIASGSGPEDYAVDFTDVTVVNRWRLVRVRRIGYASALLCVLCAGAEYAITGATLLPYIYLLNAAITAALTSVLSGANRPVVERLNIGLLILTCLAGIVLTDRVVNVAFLTGLVCFTSVYEEAPEWRRAWIFVHGAAFAIVVAHFALVPEVATGRPAFYACVLPMACTVVVLGFLFYEYVGISRRVYGANAKLNAELSERVANARAADSELQSKLAARRRVTRSIAQSVENAHRTRARLEASHEQLEQFAYAASHDLKEPIRTIKSFMRMAERKMPAAASADLELREQFAFIQSNADAMHEVLERLLVYSRSTRVGACAKTCDLQRVWQRVLVKANLPADQLRALLEGLAAQPTVALATDATKLELLFGELLSNARRFVAPGAAPAIAIAVDAPTPTHVTARITDRGIGFDPAYAEQVFGLFQRLHPREQYPSAGVGLAIVRQLSGQLGAEVTIRTAVGEGTAVAVTLPLAFAGQPTKPATPAASA